MKRIYLIAVSLVILPFVVAAQRKNVSLAGNTTSASAVYKNLNNNQYMKTWLLAGPFKLDKAAGSEPTQAEQEKFFGEDVFPPSSFTSTVNVKTMESGGQKVNWQMLASKSNQINLDSVFNQADYAAAYAFAEINADAAQVAFLAIGSDDGVKVWLNGKPVHTKWIARALTPDEDVVPVSLEKGRNTLLVKVYDVSGGWGFTSRFLEKQDLSDHLLTATRKGDLDAIEMLLQAGASANIAGKSGLTPLQVAQIYGRQEAAEMLLAKGAKPSSVPNIDAVIEDIYRSANNNAVPGIALLVAKDGKPVYSKGFGYAQINNKMRATSDTKFRIGSITKQFTAAAILKLQEEGKLKVTDKLSRFYPDFPGSDEVTLHHLLTHTSGIHSFTAKPDFITRVVSPIATDSLIHYFMNDPYDFKPGEDFRYNNSGYFLLGAIIEKASGKSYEAYLKEQFFDPLGMTNTGVYNNARKLEKEATGYSKAAADFQPAQNWDMSWAGGAGAMYSTAEDLLKWNEAVFNGKVLSAESMKAAFTPVVLNNGKTPSSGEYGYGWFIGKYRGRKTIQHSGGLDGFISQLAYYPEDKLTVVMLTNVTPSQVNVNPNSIAELYLWDKMEKQPSYSVKNAATQDVKMYEGRYQFPNLAVMTISSDGKDLFAQLTGQQKFQIYPSGNDEFFWKVVEAKIKFNKNEKGEFTSAHFSQGGAELDVQRIKEETIIAADPALYKLYTGKYDMGNSIQLQVSAEGNRIFVMATGQPKFEMFPVSKNEFITKDITARLTFPSDASGKISKLVLDMAGEKKDCPRLE